MHFIFYGRHFFPNLKTHAASQTYPKLFSVGFQLFAIEILLFYVINNNIFSRHNNIPTVYNGN